MLIIYVISTFILMMVGFWLFIIGEKEYGVGISLLGFVPFANTLFIILIILATIVYILFSGLQCLIDKIKG